MKTCKAADAPELPQRGRNLTVLAWRSKSRARVPAKGVRLSGRGRRCFTVNALLEMARPRPHCQSRRGGLRVVPGRARPRPGVALRATPLARWEPRPVPPMCKAVLPVEVLETEGAFAPTVFTSGTRAGYSHRAEAPSPGAPGGSERPPNTSESIASSSAHSRSKSGSASSYKFAWPARTSSIVWRHARSIRSKPSASLSTGGCHVPLDPIRNPV